MSTPVADGPLPSEDFSGFPAVYQIFPVPAPATAPAYVQAGLRFTWLGIPAGSNNATCGWVGHSETVPGYYDIGIPDGSGEVRFTITLQCPDVEAIQFVWHVGAFSGRIVHDPGEWDLGGGEHTTPTMTQYVNGATGQTTWDGSCTYRLWFPRGVDYPPEMWLSNGSAWEAEPGSDGNDVFPYWESGGVITWLKPGGGLFPEKYDPIGTASVSNIHINSWIPPDPDPDPDPGDGIEYAAINGVWELIPRYSALDGEWAATPLSLPFG